MAPAGVGGLDTPRTNIGDVTYLENNPKFDFDISQEPSFLSPFKSKNNLVEQLQNGRRGAIRTPRSRVALSDRRNIPAGLGGGEFTPLLKSATRNSALRLGKGKENSLSTPAFLKPGGLTDIPEDLSPLLVNSSIYGDSPNGSYMAGTPAPQLDSSSTASTPMALLPRRHEGPGVLQDGNQLSLREQEYVITKIERENFSLKLKIHFLEEALQKAGPGFSEAALKENTELKVDKVTMQKELSRYRKTLSSAERDVDQYQQQILEMQEKIKHKHMDAGQQEDLERLRQNLKDSEAEVSRLKQQANQVEDLRDQIHDLKAEALEKDRIIDDQEDEAQNLKEEVEKYVEAISSLKEAVEKEQRRNVELEEKAQVSEDLEEAKETMEEMEQDVKRLKFELEEAKEGQQEAIEERNRAQDNLDELQEEMANKSINTKGLSRQIEEKANKLQDDLEALLEKYETLSEDHTRKCHEVETLEHKIGNLQHDNESRIQKLQEKLEHSQKTGLDASQQRDKLSKQIQEIQDDLQSAKRGKDIAWQERDDLSKQFRDIQAELRKAQQDNRDDSQRRDKLSTNFQAIQDDLHTAQKESRDTSQQRDQLSRKLQITQDDLRALRQESEAAVKQRDRLLKQLEEIQVDLQQTSDEKNILQTRHDALTQESRGLQKDLARARKDIEDLEDKLDHEKTLSLNNEREVRDQYKCEIDRLNNEVEDLRAEIREKGRVYDNDSGKWESERRNLESQKDAAEEKAVGLQRSIDRLQAAEGNLSSKETKLKEALQSEKDRYAVEKASLNRQIEELNRGVEARSKSLEDVRFELSGVREELRLSQREQKLLVEKVEGLEDEVEILQTSLDDESDQANQEITAAKRELESLRQQLQDIASSSHETNNLRQTQDMVAAKHESEGLRQQIQSLKHDLAQAESAAGTARSEMDTFHANFQLSEGSQERLTSTLRDAESQLSNLRKEKQGLQDQLNAMTDNMHSLRVAKVEAEAERDEIQSQLRPIRQQEDDTFRFERERADQRTARMKLDVEVRRLREENKAMITHQEALEKELQEEMDRASAEEARLSSDILDLQKILRGSSEKRDLSSAKKTIQRLEERIRELEDQIPWGEGENDAAQELSIIRQDLSAARQKETEFLQREVSQKEVLRGLKRQIAELERKAHDVEVSRLVTSPQSSIGGSARKSEVIEARAQLAAAHESMKAIRTQLKNAEKEGSRKLTAANIEIEARLTEWGAEKDELERLLDESQFTIEDLEANNAKLKSSEKEISRKLNAANIEHQTRASEWDKEKDGLERLIDDGQFTIQELQAKNTNAEALIARLRAKIDRLEKALRAERLNVGDDRTMVLERRDLHDMLRETQVQAETLEVVVHERDNTIKAYTAAESQIKANLNRVRDERSALYLKATSAQEKLTKLERQFHEAKQSWEEEKKSLTRGVRFVNTSISTNNEDEILTLKKDLEEKEKRHVKELRGMGLQLEWLRARVNREEVFRACAAYAKKYMAFQINMYEACNRADLALLESTGVKLNKKPLVKKPTLRMVAQAVRAAIRMKMASEKWKESTKIHDRLVAQAKKQGRRSIATGRLQIL